jgi:hypothetical protein
MTNKTVFKLPAYTKTLPPHAMLSCKEIAELFGMTASGFRDRVLAGRFPQPDFNSRGGFGSSNKKHHWRLSTLRKYEAEQSAG